MTSGQKEALIWGRIVEDALDEGIWILVLAEVRENGLSWEATDGQV